ncbi:hypothetical protein PtA15_4A91 [Puccinia triticina]|uniref:Uncharacterized protein n=1 Tax=Puccinia triticina TaxID=208348 RepID=A0ABY7CFH3_9BASI|nr:uncharacterized protein PtA15_4A91 [Puccinia triticina]WAQ83643.1 hypothetical protein PtA15_4A91 [Puccinia triticina]WAR54483.1 hypothetical protein PtB15_4B100 [Puccinia triticina]
MWEESSGTTPDPTVSKSSICLLSSDGLRWLARTPASKVGGVEPERAFFALPWEARGPPGQRGGLAKVGPRSLSTRSSFIEIIPAIPLPLA